MHVLFLSGLFMVVFVIGFSGFWLRDRAISGEFYQFWVVFWGALEYLGGFLAIYADCLVERLVCVLKQLELFRSSVVQLSVRGGLPVVNNMIVFWGAPYEIFTRICSRRARGGKVRSRKPRRVQERSELEASPVVGHSADRTRRKTQVYHIRL